MAFEGLPPLAVLRIVTIVLGGVLALAVLPFLIVGIYIYVDDCWDALALSKSHRSWEKERKKWNKKSRKERNLQIAMAMTLEREAVKRTISVEQLFRYSELVEYPYIYLCPP